jgi:hypothetical protein
MTNFSNYHFPKSNGGWEKIIKDNPNCTITVIVPHILLYYTIDTILFSHLPHMSALIHLCALRKMCSFKVINEIRNSFKRYGQPFYTCKASINFQQTKAFIFETDMTDNMKYVQY